MLAATDPEAINVAKNIAFGIIALIMIVSAVNVVASKNMVRAALSLVAVMGGAAAQYLLVGAEFVAVTQVLVYVGAVMVLFLFGVMLTRAKVGADADLNNKQWALGIPVALLMLGVMVWVILDGYGSDRLPAEAEPVELVDIGDSILGPYLVPLFGLTFVLLAAIIGGIVLARKD
jgi:NADH-quinone oxidoreductase subunit J